MVLRRPGKSSLKAPLKGYFLKKMNDKDQLNEFLRQSFAHKYHTASNGHSLLVLGWKTNSQPALCIYTIPMEQHMIVANQVKSTLVNNSFYSLAYDIAQNLKVPFITVAFPTDIKDESKVCFMFSTNGIRKLEYKNSDQLETELLSFLKLRKTPTPPKEVNHHTADFFHSWSRKHLPSGAAGVIKCDLDGVFFVQWKSPSNIIVEIKRSAIPNIPEWKPRPADYSGLNFLRNVAHSLGFSFWIMHHEGTNLLPDTQIAVFNVDTNVPIGNGGPQYKAVYNPIMLKDLPTLL